MAARARAPKGKPKLSFGPRLSAKDFLPFAQVRVVAGDGKSSRTARVSDISDGGSLADVEFQHSTAGGPSEDGVGVSRLRQLDLWELEGGKETEDGSDGATL